jgi:hypothetical protein
MLPNIIRPEHFKYCPPSAEDTREFLKSLESLLEDFSAKTGIVRGTFTFNKPMILEIAARLDQRRDYVSLLPLHARQDNRDVADKEAGTALLLDHQNISRSPKTVNRQKSATKRTNAPSMS